MRKTNWIAIKVPTYPKEWKVFPANFPAWDNNSSDRYYLTQKAAQDKADEWNKKEEDKG